MFLTSRHCHSKAGKDVKKLRVLIADDNDMMRDALVMVLERKFEVMKAVPDGMSLVASAIELRPDVIVSDISMPRLSGPEAMEKLRAQKHNFPLVFVSASLPPPEESDCTFVNKTKMATDLIPAVYTAFNGHGKVHY